MKDTKSMKDKKILNTAMVVLLGAAYDFCELGLYFFFATEDKEENREIREKIL